VLQILSFITIIFIISEKRPHCSVTVTKRVLINTTKNQNRDVVCLSRVRFAPDLNAQLEAPQYHPGSELDMTTVMNGRGMRHHEVMR
jgi:putative ribosome biogenesis GTPase RsgA